MPASSTPLRLRCHTDVTLEPAQGRSRGKDHPEKQGAEVVGRGNSLLPSSTLGVVSVVVQGDAVEFFEWIGNLGARGAQA